MAKKWSKSSYGKTALSAKFSVSGVEEFFKKIEAAGKNIESEARASLSICFNFSP